MHGKFYDYNLSPFPLLVLAPRPDSLSWRRSLISLLSFSSRFLPRRRRTPCAVSVAGEGEGGAAEGGNSELLEAVAEAMWHVSSLPEHVVVVKELTAVPVLVALLHHNDEKVGVSLGGAGALVT